VALLSLRTATTHPSAHPLPLHDALPIYRPPAPSVEVVHRRVRVPHHSPFVRKHAGRGGLAHADGPGQAQNDHVSSSFRWAKTTRSEEHTSELQSRENLVCRLLLEKKKET